MSPAPTLHLEGLHFHRGRTRVLAIDEATLGPGIHHVVGPNGSGKTTLMAVLATLLSPAGGHVRLDGLDLHAAGAQARARLGYAGHKPSLEPRLSVEATLALHARAHRCPPGALELALEAWGLTALAGRPVGSLSHGETRRADLARATLHAPGLLLLDEPVTGLDAAGRAHLRAHLTGAGARVVVTTAPDEPLEVPGTLWRLDAGRLEEAGP